VDRRLRQRLDRRPELALPTLVARTVLFAGPTPAATVASGGLTALFLGFAVVVIFGAVIRPGKVDGERIAGAVSV